MKKTIGFLIAAIAGGCFTNPLFASDVENLELQFWDTISLEKAKESEQAPEEPTDPDIETETED